MIQPSRQKQIQERMLLSTSTSHQNKTILTLDDLLIGYVAGEDNNEMTIFDIKGNQFVIPSCKVISADKRNANSFVVDIEYHELLRYKVS
jgi:hypothetical protein